MAKLSKKEQEKRIAKREKERRDHRCNGCNGPTYETKKMILGLCDNCQDRVEANKRDYFTEMRVTRLDQREAQLNESITNLRIKKIELLKDIKNMESFNLFKDFLKTIKKEE